MSKAIHVGIAVALGLCSVIWKSTTEPTCTRSITLCVAFSARGRCDDADRLGK